MPAKGRNPSPLLLALFGLARRALRIGSRLGSFGDAVGDEIHQCQEKREMFPPLEEIDGVGILLSEDRYQHVLAPVTSFALDDCTWRMAR